MDATNLNIRLYMASMNVRCAMILKVLECAVGANFLPISGGYYCLFCRSA